MENSKDCMLPVVDYYYKNQKDENSIDKIVNFFDSLDCDGELVIATFHQNGMEGLDLETVTKIGNYLSSATCWSSVEDWSVDVEYTINHPEGNIFVSDNKLKTKPSATRRNVSLMWNAVFSGNGMMVRLERRIEKDTNCNDTNLTRCSFVRITRSKKFVYTSDNSSWVYKLCISWEGESKEDAELSQKKYYVSIETNDTEKASRNVKYTAISFIEKILDMAFIQSDRDRRSMKFFL